MKANVPKPYHSLPPAQRKRITDHAREVALEMAAEQTEKDARIIIDLYIKMVCVTLHDAFGFGEKRLNMFLGCHRQLFRRQAQLVKKETQREYLDKRIAEIFRKDGFPKEFFDKLLGEVENY